MSLNPQLRAAWRFAEILDASVIDTYSRGEPSPAKLRALEKIKRIHDRIATGQPVLLKRGLAS